MHILESCDHRDIVSLPLPLRIGDLANTLEMMAAGMYRRRRETEVTTEGTFRSREKSDSGCESY